MSTDKISILHLITELNVGGAERMLEKVVSSMDKGIFHNTVVSMTDIGIVGKGIADKGVSVQKLGMRNGKVNIRALFKLIGLLKSRPVDIIQTWLYHADLLGLIAGKLAGVGKISWGLRCSHVEMNNYNRISRLVLRLNTVLSKYPDLIIANSTKGMEDHKALGFNGNRMAIIHNGFDTNMFRPDPLAREYLIKHLNIPHDSLLIGLVARWDPMKDHVTFLTAALELAHQFNSVQFVLAGDGINADNENLLPFINDRKLQGRLHLLGIRQDIQRILASLDILTSSSAYGEGFSNTICEAMSCGVPCVITDVGDSADIVGDTGRIVPPRNPNAIKEAWIDLIAMGVEKRRALGEAARARIQDNYDIYAIVEQFENTYTRLVMYE